MLRAVIIVALSVTACAKKQDAPPAPAGGSGSYLTIGAYCDAFCTKLCGTCGVGDCPNSCKVRCLYGRDPGRLLDGKDPKTALALTQKELDACLATVTAETCQAIGAGQVPPACYTIQH